MFLYMQIESRGSKLMSLDPKTDEWYMNLTVATQVEHKFINELFYSRQ